MRQIEFKSVSYDPGIAKRLSGTEFGESFLELLNQHGREGWDLKEIIRESGLHAILIFSRPVD